MLSLLHIENIAVIEWAEIEFDGGFNALTGETGAGKSIVIDAIGAVLGQRTPRDLVRTGAKSALVTAEFTGVDPDLPWFRENGIGPDEDGCLLLQREIQAEGKNSCRVNGRPVTVAILRTLGNQLLNIHGQHDGQQLLDEAYHIGYLDSFSETEEELAAYQGAYAQVAALRREISALAIDEGERARRVDSLTYQIAELERAKLKPGEDEALQAKRDMLRHAGKLMDAVERAAFALSGDDNGSPGAADLVGEAESAIRTAARYDSAGTMDEISQRLAQAQSEVEDLAALVEDMKASFEFSPQELDDMESRLDVLYRLKKKYGSTVEEMLDYLARSKAELEELQDSDGRIAELEKKLKKRLAEAREKAALLSEKRRTGAERLQSRIQSELAQLDMPKVRFQVEFAPVEGELGLNENGMDQVQFLMSANVGEALKPIQKIASGGELARIMLALKTVLAENDAIGTLIFDEVDTGVSGRAAGKVAEKMASVARTKQVLCVTHLPQIAAMADVHFSVEKGERDGRTFTDVKRLDRAGRMGELARLSGGATITENMLRSAGELLDAAEAYKEKR